VIVSHYHFMLFVTVAALAICVIWGSRDVYLLLKHLPRRAREAWPDQGARRDQIFGSAVGVVIIALGIIGVVRYWSH
jgi:hypothetical protein